MLTLGELADQIDALRQLRRFDPSTPVYIDGLPIFKPPHEEAAMFRPTVDSIVSDIQRKISELRELSVSKGTEADAAYDQADTLRDNARALDEESARAESIADKFQAFLS